MKKGLYILAVMIFIFTLTACGGKKKEEKKEEKRVENSTKDINIVTSLEDEISDDTCWCGTFNLIWNELKENYVKGDIVVENPTSQINNLNKSTFTKNNLSESSYYTKFGKQVPDLKKEIEESIEKKFNQKSDILDNFEWEKDSTNDFIYAMLYKMFTFKTPFAQLENGTFNSKDDFRYFGIKKGKRNGEDQVTVLYYDDVSDNAVKLNTNEGEEIILVKTNDSNLNNFSDYYKLVSSKSDKYDGDKKLGSKDELLVPYIKFNVYKDIKELEGITFNYADESEHKIDKAVQTIKMQLSESGGDLKSEAVISTKATSAYDPDDSRKFYYDTTFIIFLKEKDKDLPYFAAKISDLSKFQK